MATFLLRAKSLVLSVIMFITSFLGIGVTLKKIEMPDAKPGVYGQWVNPFIGTGGIPWVCANLSPGATAPFGAVRLAADTVGAAGLNLLSSGKSGYYYGFRRTTGFSHTRLSGTGINDMGHFRVTPALGETNPANRLISPLPFSHNNEVATAGYYALYLPTVDCLAEMTATTHVGVHRYTFDSGRDAHLFVDSTSFLAGGSASEGKVKVLPDSMEIEGEGRVKTGFTGRYGGLKAYYVARFDTPFESFSTWNGGESAEGRAYTEGDDVGANINFGSIKGKPVELKLGISFVSIENARENLDSETNGLDFEGVRDLMRGTWDEWLSRVDIETADSEIKTIFYTALYHSMIMPTNFTDVNGEYLGFADESGVSKVSVADGFTYRTDMSLWDTFRTTHPLYILIAPEIQRDCLKSLVRMARAGGCLPRWPSGNGYTNSMFGTPADMVVAESYLKGINDFEVEEAYEFMKFTSDGGNNKRRGIDDYNTLGYCAAENVSYAVSCTLEYAWADGSIALLAEALGKSDEAAVYRAKSMNYKNLFDDETKYFRAKNADGTWYEPFNPNITNFYDAVMIVKFADDYCEGGARHWRWSAPHDTKGLIELFGSEEYFVSELEKFMADASFSRAALDPGPGFWLGNQHDIHAPYLFNDAGRPDLTQKWVRWSLAQRNSTDVDGLDGNDDGGTLSAWYVFSAMGLYPVAGTDRYWIGSPNIDKATMDMGGGKTLTVVANNQSADNIYVQSVTLNNVKLTEPSITHDMIADGGTLVFEMGASPAANGGF